MRTSWARSWSSSLVSIIVVVDGLWLQVAVFGRRGADLDDFVFHFFVVFSFQAGDFVSPASITRQSVQAERRASVVSDCNAITSVILTLSTRCQ